ncbi:MAG: EamA family transporter [Methylophilaceae bacterium]
MQTLKPWLLLTFSVLLDSAGTVLFKHGTNQLAVTSKTGWRGHLDSVVSALKRREIALGVLLYIAEYLVWLAFLSTTLLSIAFPLSSLNVILILVASAIFLGEKVGMRRWLGAALIIGGIFLVGGEA